MLAAKVCGLRKRHGAQIGLIPANGPSRGSVQPREHPKDAGLARSAAAREAQHFSRADAQVEAVNDRQVALRCWVAHSEVIHGDMHRHHVVPLSEIWPSAR